MCALNRVHVFTHMRSTPGGLLPQRSGSKKPCTSLDKVQLGNALLFPAAVALVPRCLIAASGCGAPRRQRTVALDSSNALAVVLPAWLKLHATLQGVYASKSAAGFLLGSLTPLCGAAFGCTSFFMDKGNSWLHEAHRLPLSHNVNAHKLVAGVGCAALIGLTLVLCYSQKTAAPAATGRGWVAFASGLLAMYLLAKRRWPPRL